MITYNKTYSVFAATTFILLLLLAPGIITGDSTATAANLNSTTQDNITPDHNNTATVDISQVIRSLNNLMQAQIILEEKLSNYEKRMAESKAQAQSDVREAISTIRNEYDSINKIINKQKDEADRLFKTTTVLFPFIALIIAFIPIKNVYDVNKTKSEIDAVIQSLQDKSEVIDQHLKSAHGKLQIFIEQKENISRDLLTRAKLLLEQTNPSDIISETIVTACRALTTNESEVRESLTAQAFLCQHESDWDKALEKWEELIQINPNYLKAYWGKTFTLGKLSNLPMSFSERSTYIKKTLTCLDRIIEIDPQSFDAHFQKGELLKTAADKTQTPEERRSLLESASDEYRATSNLYPTWELNLKRLGKIQIERANPALSTSHEDQRSLLESAIRFYTQLYELNQLDMEALKGLGYSNLKLASLNSADERAKNKCFKESERYFKVLEKIHPYSTKNDHLRDFFSW